MYDWLIEEELDVEAIIESIASLNILSESKEKLVQKKNTLINSINDLVNGKKSIKNFFSIKSKKDETIGLENQKTIIEGQINFLELILKISTFNMEKNIQSIKIEKLTGYYQSLKLCAEIQKFNGNNVCKISLISRFIIFGQQYRRIIILNQYLTVSKSKIIINQIRNLNFFKI